MQTISVEAATRIRELSVGTADSLRSNIAVMDANVDSKISGLNDPSLQRYTQLSGDLKSKLNMVCQKIDDIVNYCNQVIAWVDNYNAN